MTQASPCAAPLDKTGLICFATEAVKAICELSEGLFRQSTRTNSFLLDLKTLLKDVLTRLSRPESLAETRVLRLLFALETLSRVGVSPFMISSGLTQVAHAVAERFFGS